MREVHQQPLPRGRKKRGDSRSMRENFSCRDEWIVMNVRNKKQKRKESRFVPGNEGGIGQCKSAIGRRKTVPR